VRLPARLAALERALPAARWRPMLLWLDWHADAVLIDGVTFTRTDGETMDDLAARAVAASQAAHPDRRVIVFSWQRP
jgi:hypothetical protein